MTITADQGEVINNHKEIAHSQDQNSKSEGFTSSPAFSKKNQRKARKKSRHVTPSQKQIQSPQSDSSNSSKEWFPPNSDVDEESELSRTPTSASPHPDMVNKSTRTSLQADSDLGGEPSKDAEPHTEDRGFLSPANSGTIQIDLLNELENFIEEWMGKCNGFLQQHQLKDMLQQVVNIVTNIKGECVHLKY